MGQGISNRLFGPLVQQFLLYVAVVVLIRVAFAAAGIEPNVLLTFFSAVGLSAYWFVRSTGRAFRKLDALIVSCFGSVALAIVAVDVFHNPAETVAKNSWGTEHFVLYSLIFFAIYYIFFVALNFLGLLFASRFLAKK